MKNLLLNILAFAALLSAVLVITSKNPVTSLIFLIFTFINIALYLIVYGITFIGISYIIIYIGAITVIFLFIIMMINIKLSDITEVGSQYTKFIPLSVAIGSLFMYELFTILPFTFNNVSAISYFLNIFNYLNLFLISVDDFSLINKVFISYNPINTDTTFINFLHIQSIGQSLYTYSAILLIIIAIILLLAMVFPIFIHLSQKKIK